MSNEIWKQIPEFDGYEARSLGNIRKRTNDDYREVTQFLNTDGYYQVILLDCKPSHLGVARLVGYAFHGLPPNNSYVVDHRNNDHKDNRPENLEWISRSENLRRAKKFGRVPTKNTKVKCLETGQVFSSIAEASKAFGIRYETMRYVTYERLKCKGKHFEKVD